MDADIRIMIDRLANEISEKCDRVSMSDKFVIKELPDNVLEDARRAKEETEVNLKKIITKIG